MTTEADSGRGLSHSSSFTGYSSGAMADTAARVVSEFSLDDGDYYNDVVYQYDPDQINEHNSNKEEDEDEDESVEDTDFEFAFAVPAAEENSSPISADEIFSNGQIKPLFPLFGSAEFRQTPTPEVNSIRVPLKKLLLSERETSLTASPSCSSSEADDLESANPSTYCVWTPPKQEMSKKSKSTGSSKRWRLRNLVHRSHSDGRESFGSVPPKPPQEEQIPPAAGNAHMEHYLKNRAMRENDRKKSYLPYKQDLVGFFANVNGLSRTMQPF